MPEPTEHPESVLVHFGTIDVRYHHVAGHWWRHETPTLMSGLVVRYTRGTPGHDRALEVSASRDGVSIADGACLPHKGVEDIVVVLRLAQRQAEQLAACRWSLRQTALPVEMDRRYAFDHGLRTEVT